MSVFLMGVRDEKSGKYKTVTKCGNGHTDEQLDKLNKELKPKVRNSSHFCIMLVFLNSESKRAHDKNEIATLSFSDEKDFSS